MTEHPKQSTAMTMGELIGVALDEDDVTQAEFCRRVGVSPKHMNEVIRGRTVARPGTLDYWAYMLDRRWKVTLERREEG